MISSFSAPIIIIFVVLHAGLFGYYATKYLRYTTSCFWAQFAVSGALGLFILWFEIFLLGHLGALTRLSFYLSSCVMVFVFAGTYPVFIKWKEAAIHELKAIFYEDRVLAISCLGMLLLIFISSARPPFFSDEIRYHWAAPLLWAKECKWIESTYCFTNGPSLMEMLYTVGAVFSNVMVAHLTHALLLVVLIACCAALARVTGGIAIASMAACLSIPVIVNQAVICYNDLAAAAFIFCAYTAIICGSEKSSKGEELSYSSVLVAGLLFSAGVSTKIYVLAALPAALIYIIYRKHSPRFLIPLILPTVITFLIWTAHTYSLTGHIWDPTAKYWFSRDSSDLFWQRGYTLGKLPTFKSILELPIVPIITSVFGQEEPYGGRTGLISLIFLPMGILSLRFLDKSQRNKALFILASGLTYFFIFGIVVLKTRFYIFVWASFSVIAAIAYDRFCKGLYTAKERICAIVFYILVWIGMADIAHVLLRGLTRFY